MFTDILEASPKPGAEARRKALCAVKRVRRDCEVVETRWKGREVM
jgi:hypothetical protein